MADSPDEATSERQPLASILEWHFLSTVNIRRRLDLLKWLMPAGLLLLVVVYEAGPSRWILRNLGDLYHFLGQVLIYGTVGPILAFKLLDFFSRWLEECETSELQAQVLARAREQAQINHRLNDDTLQALFAAGALIAALESDPATSPEALTQLHGAQQAIQQTIQKLHAHLGMRIN